jgi:hypothetical protein
MILCHGVVQLNANVSNIAFQKLAKDCQLEVESRMGSQSRVLKRKIVPVTPVQSAHKLRKVTGYENTAASENNPCPIQRNAVCSSPCLLNFWTLLLLLLSSYSDFPVSAQWLMLKWMLIETAVKLGWVWFSDCERRVLSFFKPSKSNWQQTCNI